MMEQSRTSLDPELVDDILYFVRINEKYDLEQTLRQACEQYELTASEVLVQCVDPRSGNSSLHYSAANGFTGRYQLSHPKSVLD